MNPRDEIEGVMQSHMLQRERLDLEASLTPSELAARETYIAESMAAIRDGRDLPAKPPGLAGVWPQAPGRETQR